MIDIPAPYTYMLNSKGQGYLLLPANAKLFERIPDSVTVFGSKLLRKNEFHITLASLPDLIARVPGTSATEDDLLKIFVEEVAQHPVSFEAFLPDFRHAQQGDRETIVVRCTVRNLDVVYRAWGKRLGGPVGQQPTHVTIYSKDPSIGIGINTIEDMEALPELSFPELEENLI